MVCDLISRCILQHLLNFLTMRIALIVRYFISPVEAHIDSERVSTTTSDPMHNMLQTISLPILWCQHL